MDAAPNPNALAEADLPPPVTCALADVFWLSYTLSSAHPAVIVPPLPLLALAGHVAQGAARVAGIARFATCAAAHPVLAVDSALQSFLGMHGADL